MFIKNHFSGYIWEQASKFWFSFFVKKCSEQLTNSVRLFFRTSYTTDLFLFIIGHFFLSSMWSSNIRNFVQKGELEYFNCKTLKTVNHWFGLLSWICFTISHSLSSCLCFIFWHFSEHILSPHLALQSDKSIPVWEQFAQKFGVKLWGGPVIKGHSSKITSSLCTRANQKVGLVLTTKNLSVLHCGKSWILDFKRSLILKHKLKLRQKICRPHIDWQYCQVMSCLRHTSPRGRPRFFDQVGHQTTNASIENKHFFTK